MKSPAVTMVPLPAASLDPTGLGSVRRILLVEGERGIRQMSADVLRNEG